MRRNFFPKTLLAAWLIALSVIYSRSQVASAQEKPDLVTLVPAPEWQLTGSQPTDASALERWHGDAAIEHEYGVTALTARTYQFNGHKADVLIEQTTDTSAAYGLLTFYRSAAMAPVRGMLVTSELGDVTLMVRGPAFIRCSVSARETLAEPDYRALLKTIGGPPPSARALEQLPAPLPSAGRLQGSERYLLGPLAAGRILPLFPANLIGFDAGAEVQTADYALGADKLTLVAINYPTPQIARTAFDSISGKLGAPTGAKPDEFESRREDTYVLVTLNATSAAVANRFLDQFKVSKTISEDQVTSEHSEAMQLVNLLFANAVLIVALAGVSLAGGLLVFASKRLARRWFANSAFVEAENGGFTILNLRWTK
jgi:hypothetical protein